MKIIDEKIQRRHISEDHIHGLKDYEVQMSVLPKLMYIEQCSLNPNPSRPFLFFF